MPRYLADGESAPVHPAGDFRVALAGLVATNAPGFDAAPSLAPGRRVEPPAALPRRDRDVAAPARGIGRRAGLARQDGRERPLARRQIAFRAAPPLHQGAGRIPVSVGERG